MNTIDEIMALIDWNMSPSDQEKGIAMAREVACLKCFFQPIGPKYGKNVWENCAVIVIERTDAQLTPYLLDMLLWLRDLNWPGAELIQQRLIRFKDVGMLAQQLNDLIPILVLLQKHNWLIFIADLLKNEELTEMLDVETKKALWACSSQNNAEMIEADCCPES